MEVTGSETARGRMATYVLQVIWIYVLLLLATATQALTTQKVALPRFSDLTSSYPGYYHHGGQYNNHQLLKLIGVKETENLLIHDTSALRISYTLNKIGGEHSLGTQMVRLSKFGRDSVEGKEGLQYIYLPIAYGPFLADKYGYPTISKLHQLNPIVTEHNFWGKQGILRVITYSNHGNQPKGHVALWDCTHFHQSKDWIKGHPLVTVEFWESPDSNCTGVDNSANRTDNSTSGNTASQTLQTPGNLMKLVQHSESLSSRQRLLKSILLPKNARHAQHKLRNHGYVQSLSKT